MKPITTGELAEKLGAVLDGDPNVLLSGVAGVGEAEPGELSFIHNPKYIDKIATTRASALIIPADLETDFRPVLRCDNPYLTFAKAITFLTSQKPVPEPGIHPTAVIAEGVYISLSASIQAQVVIEEGAYIGENTVLYPMSYVGKGTVIGDGCVIHPRVTIGERVAIGPNCLIHAGTSIGSDSPPERLEFYNSPCVEIGEDVEVGANVVVARGKQRPTKIGSNTKIDNLVQIGSGVQLGNNCIIVAQVGIEEDATLEAGVTLAGHTAVRPGVTIGKGATIAAQSVVETDVPPGEVYFGSPAKPHEQEMRIKVSVNRLPTLFKTVKELERKIEEQPKEDVSVKTDG